MQILTVYSAELAAEWHPTRNGDLTPEQVSYGSVKKVWWLGKCGHAWEASIHNRTYGGNGCPICSGHLVLPGFNDLVTTYPGIAAEWHPTKNGALTSEQVPPFSKKKVWWQCSHGHEWQAVISSRTRNQAGCPICSGRQVLPGFNDLATVCPELAVEWHPTKNGELTPSQITLGSGRKVWWQCRQGHDWQASPANRYKVTEHRIAGCPYCVGRSIVPGLNDLATVSPKLAAEWHPTRNGGFLPSQVFPFSNKKVWWQCSTCGREWRAVIASRSQGNGCASCVRKNAAWFVTPGVDDLASIAPELASEWHPTKNGELTPAQVTYGSRKRVWWQCSQGHEWQAIIANRCVCSSCPYCAKRLPVPGVTDLATVAPDIAAQWHPTKNGDLIPEQVTDRSTKVVWWQCSEGHEWQRSVRNRAYKVKNSYCPMCGKKKT